MIYLTTPRRNDPCYCGSGLKYKKCCLTNDEDKIRSGKTGHEREDIDHSGTQHGQIAGIRAFALSLLEQLTIWLSSTHISPTNIQQHAMMLRDLTSTDDMEQYYINMLKSFMENSGVSVSQQQLTSLHQEVKTFPSLTENERNVIRSIAQSFLFEYIQLGHGEKVDYLAMKIFGDFCYAAIKQGIPDEQYVVSATLFVDSNGENNEKLINWELNYAEYNQHPMGLVFINWIPLDELKHEYLIITHSYHGFEEDSKKELATAMYQEQSLPAKSQELISYRGLVSIYTGVLEKELRKLIELKENEMQSNLMMKNINTYIRNNDIPGLIENMPDLYARLEEIRMIRNRAAHGEDISYDDYMKVKNLLINNLLFKFISSAKVAYKDDLEREPFV